MYRYKLVVVAKTQFHQNNTLMLKKLGIFEYFDDFLFYDGSDLALNTLGEFNQVLLQHKLDKYLAQHIRKSFI
jgi:hypothetical protein